MELRIFWLHEVVVTTVPAVSLLEALLLSPSAVSLLRLSPSGVADVASDIMLNWDDDGFEDLAAGVVMIHVLVYLSAIASRERIGSFSLLTITSVAVDNNTDGTTPFLAAAALGATGKAVTAKALKHKTVESDNTSKATMVQYLRSSKLLVQCNAGYW